jgi:hypothetical protein
MSLGSSAAWEGVEPREGAVLGWRDLGRRPGARTPRAGAAWRARAWALWPARRRGAGRFQRDGFDLGHFDQVFLPKLELQCIEV